MAKKYVVEPRNEDGTLNAKDPNKCFMTFPAEGVTLNQIFDYFFKQNPGYESVGQEQVAEFFKSKGWYFREKTW